MSKIIPIKCAILTSDEHPELIKDDQILLKAMLELGWEAKPVIWNQEHKWSDYNLALIRNTWDYSDNLQQFLSVLKHIEKAGVLLLNPYEIVKWNSNKKYLLDLKKWDIPIVPTVIVDKPKSTQWIAQVSDLGWDNFILKPTVGAGGRNTHKIDFENLSLLGTIFEESKMTEWIVQPYIKSISTEGELSFMFFNGKFSFAIAKIPKKNEFRIHEYYGGTNRKITPGQKDLKAVQAIIENCKKQFTYARVDVVRMSNGKLAVMELETIEPQLYYTHHKPSISDFITAIIDSIKKKL